LKKFGHLKVSVASNAVSVTKYRIGCPVVAS